MKKHSAATVQHNLPEALVAVWFGTAVPGAEASYLPVEEELRRRNPGIPLHRAYLSGMIRRRLGGAVPAPAECLKQLRDAGIRRVRVFAGLLTAGEEFDRLRAELAPFLPENGGFDALLLSRPVCAEPVRRRQFFAAVAATVPAGDAALFLGHGHADGRSDALYCAAAAEWRKFHPGLFLACVEGRPAFEEVREELLHAEINRLLLRPLLLTAGDHARNDLAGAGAESWKSQLEATGIECIPELRGLGEYPAVAALPAATPFFPMEHLNCNTMERK